MMPDDFFLQSHTPKGTLWPIAPRIGVRLRCSYLSQKVVQNEKTQHFHCEAPTMTSTLSEPQIVPGPAQKRCPSKLARSRENGASAQNAGS